MQVAIGSDHGGFAVKTMIKSYLEDKGFTVEDVGTDSEQSCDYPVFAFKVAETVARGKAQRGIIVCRTGIGSSIAANKVRSVRAALCCNEDAIIYSRKHNNANVLVLGAKYTGDRAQLYAWLDVWFSTEFEGGRHQRRLALIEQYEENTLCGNG